MAEVAHSPLRLRLSFKLHGGIMSYRRSKERDRRLKKLYWQTRTNGDRGAYYDIQKGRYIRFSCSDSPSLAKSLRRQSSKKARTTRDYANHAGYRRVFDYWWNFS